MRCNVGCPPPPQGCARKVFFRELFSSESCADMIVVCVSMCVCVCVCVCVILPIIGCSTLNALQLGSR